MRSLSYACCVSAIVPLAVGATAVRAQTTPAVAEDTGGLEEIVVTAQRRAQNLQDVPIAVIAVSGKQLAASGVDSTRDLPTVAPGLTIRTTVGSFQPYIRGVGTSSTVAENPVALYIDGVYFAQQREGLIELNDIEQVAVLKGPQGTLFGRNATGGVIQITTRRPQHELRGEFGASIDNYAYTKADMYLTGGISENLAASFSAHFATQGEGWGDNVTTGNDTYRVRHYGSVRAKFLYEPGPDTSIMLIGDYLDRDALANSFQSYPGTRQSFVQLAPLKSRYDTYAGTDATVAFRGGGVSLNVDHNLGFAKLLSISSYRKGRGSYVFDNAFDPASSFVVRAPRLPNETYTQELQLSSSRGPLSWVLGGYYFHNLNGALPNRRVITGALAPLPTSVTINSSSGTETSESVAVFGQADWEFSPGSTLTLGARYTYEDRKVDATQTLIRNNGVRTVITPVITKTSFEKPTFRVALSHEFTNDVMGYVSLNTGTKSGGFNFLSAANPPYDPEKLTAYEVGLKTQLFDRRLRFNVAAFYYDYTNLQVIQFNTGVQTVANGPKAKLYGLDIDLEAELSEGLRLRGGMLIEHSEFTKFPNAVFSTPLPTGGASVFQADAEGNRLPLAQEVVATLAVDYHREVGSGDALDLNLTGNYNGNYFFDPDNFLRQDSYLLVNTAVSWTSRNDRIRLSIWGKNLLNEAVIQQPTAQVYAYPTTWGTAPRTYGVSARFMF